MRSMSTSKWGENRTARDVFDLLVDASREGKQGRRSAGCRRSVEFCLQTQFKLLAIVVERAEQLRERLDERSAIRLEIRCAEKSDAEHLRDVRSVSVQMVNLDERGNRETTS